MICLICSGDVNGDGTEDDRVVLRGTALRGRIQRRLIAVLTEQLIALAIIVGLEKHATAVKEVMAYTLMASHARRETPTRDTAPDNDAVLGKTRSSR